LTKKKRREGIEQRKSSDLKLNSLRCRASERVVKKKEEREQRCERLLKRNAGLVEGREPAQPIKRVTSKVLLWGGEGGGMAEDSSKSPQCKKRWNDPCPPPG